MRRHLASLAPAATAVLLLAGPLAAQPFVFTHFAGTIGGPDAFDGQGAEARFSSPNAAAFDGEGNLYVADTRNLTVRKMTPTGVVTTLAGLAGAPGSRDGLGGAARFELPAGIGADGAGHVYVADAASSTIRKIDLSTGLVSTFAGRAGRPGSADGAGSAAGFSAPTGLAVDTVGNVYVADAEAATIRKITPAGVVTTLAGSPGQRGDADGEGGEARFDHPRALTVDRFGNVYVVEERLCTIRKVTSQGFVTTLAGEAGTPGNADGNGNAARFRSPGGIAADSTGILYVADSGNGTLRRVTPAGVVTTLAGSGAFGSVDATGKEASFARPLGVAVDANDGILVTEEGSALRRVTPSGTVTTVAGRPRVYGFSDASGVDALFVDPPAVAASRRGYVYVADAGASTIRKVSPDGTVTTLAGLAGKPGYTDGPVSQAMFDAPSGVAVDADENVYVADRGNKSIRRISSTGFVTTLAGDTYAPAASVDGTGTDARFAYPVAVALDAAGNVWVAEESHAIRRVTPAGVVTTPAGSASQPGSADGPGGSARFLSPRGLASDALGNVWVADTGNSTVRRISPLGVVTTVAGVPQSPGTADGVGPEARFVAPSGIAVDASGRAWVADAGSHTLRRIAADRSVTTVGGAAALAGAADGTGTDARFDGPSGVAAGADGRLFVADRGNASVRVGTPATLRDAATIDAAAALVGQRRQLDTDPRAANRWQWQLVRKPAASRAALSATNVRNPTFTPDVADFYVFRLTAENGAATSITTVTLSAGTDAPPRESVSRLVPIVLDVASGAAHYVTDLALTNDTSSRLDVALRYTAALGSKEGSGTVTDSLAPGEQKRIADVLSWLRGRGLPLPSPEAQPQQGGTLLVTFLGPSAIDARRVSATARTAALTGAPQPPGRAGLAYSGLLESEGSTTSVTLYGLRSTASDRTNVAVFNTSDEPVTVNVTVCSGTGDARCVTFRGSETLPPRGWVQYGSAELLDSTGIERGWATIARTSTTGSFGAYAVVNDNGTNDGSYVVPVADGAAATTFTVPVLVETPAFRSELVLANATFQAATFVLDYVESISPASGAGGSLLVTLRPREELILPEAIDWLRKSRVAIGPKGEASYGGSLTVTVTPQAAAGAFAGARTAAASPAGGQFGLFVPSLSPQQQAWSEAWVYGLRADGENRSNVAVLHSGTAADGPLLLQLQAFDGNAGGAPRGEPLSVALSPGQWAQPADFFRASGVANGWVRVTRMSGTGPWIAYGVVNDGGSPGERTGDGAYVPMVK